MKLVRITTPAFAAQMTQFNAEHPELPSRCWAEQQKILNDNWFGYPNVWKYALEPLGYEVIDIFANAEVVQKTWAKERGLDYYESHWHLDITKAQILHEKPDVLFVMDMFTFSYEWLTEVREQCSSIKFVLGWCGAPWPNTSIFKAYDLTLSCIPEVVEQLRIMGHQSEHLNHAFESRILEHLDLSSEPNIDFSFVGNINRKSQFHLERDRILEKLVSEVNVEIFSRAATMDRGVVNDLKALARDGAYSTVKILQAVGMPNSILAKTPILKRFTTLPSRPLRSVNPKLRPFLRNEVYGLKMFQTLRNSKATFNKHIDLSPRSASNLRLFEATGVGTCLVTDYKENIHTLFEPDKEIVTYSSVEECVEKVKWLMAHPAECKAIAKAGQARTLKEHTLNQRAIVINTLIKRGLQTPYPEPSLYLLSS